MQASDYIRGHKHSLELDVGHSGIQLPILLVRGSHEGAALVVTAGIHGDEYEGVRAIFDVVETLDPAAMRGDLIAVPVANPPAFWAGTRRSPLDGVNLARIFPGAPDQGPSEAIAHTLARQVIAQADFYLDLHSAGVAFLMPTMVGYNANDSRGRAAAELLRSTRHVESSDHRPRPHHLVRARARHPVALHRSPRRRSHPPRRPRRFS